MPTSYDPRSLALLTQTSTQMPSGSRAGRGSEATGYIPELPDPLDEVKKALGLYTSSLPTLMNNAGQLNTFNQGQLVKQITDLYPQFQQNVNQIGADIGDWASGAVSSSTKNALAQAMAERGGGGGMAAGSPVDNAVYLGLLGKTSEGLQAAAVEAQNKLLSGLPHAPLTDPTKLIASPEALLSAIFEGDVNRATINAAPDPAAAFNLALQAAQQGLLQGKGAATGPFGVSTGTGTPVSGLDYSKVLASILGGQGGGPGVVVRGSQGTGNTTDNTAANWLAWNNSMPWSQGGGNSSTTANENAWLDQFWNDWDASFSGSGNDASGGSGLSDYPAGYVPIGYTGDSGVNTDDWVDQFWQDWDASFNP